MVLAVAASVAEGGLLRVPRVYNALISTNQRLAPSRADPVSIPVPLVGVAAPVALLPTLVAATAVEEPEAASRNSSSPDAKPDEAPAASNDTATHVLPLALYGAYGYYPYSYHYHTAASFLLPPPLLHPYTYGVLPLLHAPLAVPAKTPAEGDAKAEKTDDAKESVSVEASR